jgi:hypothetical protein
MRTIGSGLAGACALLGAGTAAAQSCATYPYSFASGTVAYASQVNSNFACAALTGKGLFTGNVAIGTATPYALLDLGNAITTIKLAIFETGNSTFYGLGVNNGEMTFGAALASTTSTPQMVLTSSGYLGIGTTAPADALDVTAPIVLGNSTERLSINSGSIGFNRRVATGQIYNTSAYAYQWQHIASSTAASDWLELQVYAPGGGTVTGSALAVNGNGGVTVGGGQLSTYLFSSNGVAGGTNSWATTSDARLKTNIVPLAGALSAVLKLQGVSYSFIAPQNRTVGQDLNLPDTPQVGFLAQDVAKVAPQAVLAPADPTAQTYGLMESKLIPYLVEAIKAQQAEIATLQAQVAALQGTH